MSPEDRAYLDGLRDDLCARHGFTWRDVVRAEQRRRIEVAHANLHASLIKAGAAAQRVADAINKMNPKGVAR